MNEPTRTDRTRVRLSTLQEQGSDDLITDKTPAELMAMVWPLTMSVWAFKDPAAVKRRLQRDVVRVIPRES